MDIEDIRRRLRAQIDAVGADQVALRSGLPRMTLRRFAYGKTGQPREPVWSDLVAYIVERRSGVQPHQVAGVLEAVRQFRGVLDELESEARRTAGATAPAIAAALDADPLTATPPPADAGRQASAPKARRRARG